MSLFPASSWHQTLILVQVSFSIEEPHIYYALICCAASIFSEMPSIVRPNAPDRLPSADFGNLFFKPRALRGSEGQASVINLSPLSSPLHVATRRRTLRSSESGLPNPASPLASPSIMTGPRRPIYVERYSHRSEASSHSSHLPPFQDTITDECEDDEPPQLKLKKRSSSSLSTRARRFLGIQTLDADPGDNDDRPPREARSGFGWKRDFLGGWLEISVGRKPDGQSRAASEPKTPTRISQAPTIYEPWSEVSRTASTHGRERWSNVASDQPLLPDTPDEFDSAASTPKEGLYCRTKRVLGLKRDDLNSINVVTRTRTPTANVLDRVSSTLKLVNVRRETSDSTATSVSNLSIAAPRWQRFRPGKNYSTSSSIRGIMMGKPPIPTPEPELMYTASDAHQYVAVEISEPNNPKFLPSEARRVHTPPLPVESPSGAKLRGFFFDYSAPSVETSPPMRSVREHEASTGTARSGSVTGLDWYRVKLDAIELDTVSREEFAASVPDHLPNSPLCPRHPKHKSGGTGTCTFHGRNKSPPHLSQVHQPTSRTEESTSPSQNWW